MEKKDNNNIFEATREELREAVLSIWECAIKIDTAGRAVPDVYDTLNEQCERFMDEYDNTWEVDELRIAYLCIMTNWHKFWERLFYNEFMTLHRNFKSLVECVKKLYPDADWLKEFESDARRVHITKNDD
jgi:hypothetical protein